MNAQLDLGMDRLAAGSAATSSLCKGGRGVGGRRAELDLRSSQARNAGLMVDGRRFARHLVAASRRPSTFGTSTADTVGRRRTLMAAASASVMMSTTVQEVLEMFGAARRRSA
jgi:hypothetical protein